MGETGSRLRSALRVPSELNDEDLFVSDKADREMRLRSWPSILPAAGDEKSGAGEETKGQNGSWSRPWGVVGIRPR